MRVSAILAMLLMSGCSNADRPAQAGAQQPPSDGSPPSPTTEEVQVRAAAGVGTAANGEPIHGLDRYPGHVGVSYVLADDKEMLWCDTTEITVNYPPGSTLTDREVEARARKSLAAMKGVVALPETCSKTFPGRALLAECRQPGDSGSIEGVPVDTSVVRFYYAWKDVFGTRKNHLACIKDGGKWRSVSEDSREAREARVEGAMRDIDAMR